MWIMNLGRPTKVPQLNENQAIELGSHILGEALIFGIGASVLVFEFNRDSRKKKEKEAALNNDLNQIIEVIQELYCLSEKQTADVEELKAEIKRRFQ